MELLKDPQVQEVIKYLVPGWTAHGQTTSNMAHWCCSGKSQMNIQCMATVSAKQIVDAATATAPPVKKQLEEVIAAQKTLIQNLVHCVAYLEEKLEAIKEGHEKPQLPSKQDTSLSELPVSHQDKRPPLVICDDNTGFLPAHLTW